MYIPFDYLKQKAIYLLRLVGVTLTVILVPLVALGEWYEEDKAGDYSDYLSINWKCYCTAVKEEYKKFKE